MRWWGVQERVALEPDGSCSIAMVKAFAFGITIAVAVGPIAVLILNYGLTRGFTAALRAAIGAACADLTFAVIAFTVGVAVIHLLASHRSTFQTTSSLVLTAFGVWMVLAALRRKNRATSRDEPPTIGRELSTTYALTVLNPLTIVAFVAFAGQITSKSSFPVALILACMVFLGSLSVQVAVACVGVSLGKVITNHRYVTALNVLSGSGIAAFGLHGILAA